MARDLTLKMALTWVGVPELGWYIWNRNDVHGIKAKYAVAQQCNLDNMADATIDAFEELKAKFEAAQEAHIQEIVEWEKWSPPADNPDMRRPPPPVYKGPTEMNFKIAEARVQDAPVDVGESPRFLRRVLPFTIPGGSISISR